MDNLLVPCSQSQPPLPRHNRHRHVAAAPRRATLLAGLVLTLLGTPSYAVPNIRLTNDLASSENPRVAFDPQGNVVAVWQDNRTGNLEIYWQKFDPLGAPLTLPVRVSTTAGDAKNPDVACDAGGTSHVVWVKDPNINTAGTVYLARLDPAGATVLPAFVLDTQAGGVRVASSAAGVTDVTWARFPVGGAGDVYYRRYDSGGAQTCQQTFNFGTMPPDPKTPAIATYGNGNAIVYWRDLDIFFNQFLARGGANFTPTPCIRVNRSAVLSSTSAVNPAVDAAGTTDIMVYQSGGNIYHLPTGGAACKLSTGSGTSTRPSVAFDGTTSFVTWQDTRDGNSEIYYAEAAGCTNVSGDRRLTTQAASSVAPDIAVEKSGNHHWVVAWSDNRDGNSEIYMTSGDQPFVSAPVEYRVAEGDPAQFTVTASDPDGEAITSLTAGGLPADATFTVAPDQSSGDFSWQTDATDLGDYPVVFTATNSLPGSATTTVRVGNKYEIVDQTLDRSYYYIGQDATLGLTIRNNTLAAATLTIEVTELQGTLSAPLEFPIASIPVLVDPLSTAAPTIPFFIQGTAISGISPFHVRIRIWDSGNVLRAERQDLEFWTTSATVVEIQQAVDEIDLCSQVNPVADSFGKVFPCVRTFAGDLGVPGAIFGTALAYNGIIGSACRAARYAAEGNTCKRNVSYAMLGLSVLSMYASVSTLLGTGGAAVGFVGGLAPFRCALNLVSGGQVESWVCSYFGGGAGRAPFAAQTVVGTGEKARALLSNTTEACDSTGIEFYAHVAVEGPVTGRITMPAGWVTTDSTSIDDGVGWVLAPDTLQWFAIGNRPSPTAAGFDTTMADIDDVEPMRVEMTATGAGLVFVGILRRPLGTSDTDSIYFDPIPVLATTRMAAQVGGGNPLFLDYDGDGDWDEVRYPPNTILTGLEAEAGVGPARGWMKVHPTPASGSVTIRYALPARARTVLRIYDVRGRLVKTISDEVRSPGEYRDRWDGTAVSGQRVATGVYYVVLTQGKGGLQRRVVLVR